MQNISRIPDVPNGSRPCHTERKMLEKGALVFIHPEFQDRGDELFTWMVVGDEEKGRVDICPVNSNLSIKPVYTLRADQVTVQPDTA